ncbi:MAG TPA: hypothetical protein VES95_10550 [Dermatophilaceae bacterium]|nr:hypothetical protein [Dermatophilaceae bacterium]
MGQRRLRSTPTNAASTPREILVNLRALAKSALVIKGVQIAQRELSKPENQRRLKEGMRNLQARRSR